jgi:hypothetical protein
MQRIFSGTLAGLLSMGMFASGAVANDCASAGDLAALRTAALQQELMVAAFSCHDVALYNRFVTSHQPELIQSDATLKAFFVRRDAHHSEAGYHTYKTELANASSLRYLHDDDFCANADSEFRTMLQPANLSDIADTGEDEIAAIYQACPGALPLMRTADAQPPARTDITGERHDRDDRDIARAHSRDRDGDNARASAQMSIPAAHREIDDQP